MSSGSRVANPILPSWPCLAAPLSMAGAEEQPDATMNETDALELKMFQTYFPAGIDQASTVASEGAPGGSDRGQPTPRIGSGNKGQQRGKGPTKEEEKDPWASWGSAKRGWQQWDQEKQTQNREALREEIRQLKESMFQLQRLALRHEDYLGGFRPETSYAVFMRMGVHASVVPAMFRAQQAWRELKEAEPDKVDKPMRVALLNCIFMEFAGRLDKLPQQTGTLENLIKLGWMKQDTLDWYYLRWDPKVERLRQDETREPIPCAKGVATVEAIRLLVSQTGPVTRFHPSRGIEEEMKGSTVTFSLQLALFDPGAVQLRGYLQELANNAITQIMAFAWRPERPGRSQVANGVQKTIQAPSSRGNGGSYGGGRSSRDWK